MVAIRIDKFAGIAPRYSDRLLPPNAAAIAKNAKLVSGELRGLREPTPVRDFTALGFTVRRAFRIPNNIQAPIPMVGSDTWIPFQDEAVDFVRSPVLGDSFERYYWTGDSTVYSGVPKYNTRARLIASNAAYRLGIPRPVAAPVVTPPAGSTLTRAYVYTFFSEFGEEGQPSNPTTASGNAGTWVISGIDASVPNPTERSITHVRIYRTVPGFASTQFFFVAQITLGTTSYNDAAPDATVALNPILESTAWAQPPATLQGLTVHPGGFLVGFSGRDLYFSEPFRAHAWPVEYILTCQTEIVGLAVFRNSVVVATNSHPYVAEGVHPSSMNFQKLDSPDPCLSRRSLATTLTGVLYSSAQGVLQIGPGGPQLITHALLTRDEWFSRYNPAGVKAAPYGLQYVAFDTPDKGFMLSPDEQLAPLADTDRPGSISGVQADPYTGEVYVIRSNVVYLWDPVGSLPFAYQWRSKVFDLPTPVNFGALQVKFRNFSVETSSAALQQYQSFNTARIATPLNCINLAAVGAVKKVTIPGSTLPQDKAPVGGSPLFNLTVLQFPTPAVTVRVFARRGDSTFNEVFTYTVMDEDLHRLPADFMSDVWQVELVSNTDIYSFAMAETGKELRKV